MIPIIKNAEPPSLTVLRQEAEEKGLSPEEAYNTLRGDLKDEVRRSLIEEQGRLCAYCMCRIPEENAATGISPIGIEHYIARNPEDGRDAGQGLDYNNMLAVCSGNRSPRTSHHRYRDLTCDAHRKNKEFLKADPLKPETLTSIAYKTGGEIYADDPDVNTDLTVTLNLNCRTAPVLSERKAALEALMSDMVKVEQEDLKEYCKNRLDAFQNESINKTPYQGILVWYLRSMFEALS